jgi:hypothetical protein
MSITQGSFRVPAVQTAELSERPLTKSAYPARTSISKAGRAGRLNPLAPSTAFFLEFRWFRGRCAPHLPIPK